MGQAYAQLFPEKLSGFVSIDSAPLQREYVSAAEIWLLKRMEPVYRFYPWNALLKTGSRGVATSEYGRKLMHDMMMAYDGDQDLVRQNSPGMVSGCWQRQWKRIFRTRSNARHFSFAGKKTMQVLASDTIRHGIRKQAFRLNGLKGQDTIPIPMHRRR